jgi:hypothetical protein
MSSTSNPIGQDQPQSISLTVFDAYVSSPSTVANLTVTAQTNNEFNDILGFYDQLAFQVVVADTMVGTAPAGLTMHIEHSADDLHFVNKNTSPEVGLPSQLNIGRETYMSFGFDGGSAPSLGFVRLVLVLTAAVGPVRAHVRITVTGNNQNEQAFSRTVAKAMSAQAMASKKYVLQYGPGQKIATSAISELIQFINDFPTVSDADLILQRPSDGAQAKALHLWMPILILKNAGQFSRSSVIVPNDFIIAFLGNGHYVLVTGGVALWESRQPSTGLFPPSREYHLANPSVKESWSPALSDHTGPGYTTGGNPIAGKINPEQGKGK